MTKFILITLLFIGATICLANAREVKCPEGSFYRQYPQLCEQTCEKPEIVECNPADKNNGPFGCRCDRQHVRHNGICITPDKCPKPCK
ncbi:serine protease inhibitor swm-1-like [Aphidius gifuensis]|uniref:serine protease inhibitor swm-1-like n=1 Tax=Aphidius gifuensis TaxID=684658 RepID=UPI001CDBD178|nr:serine protease inhibitor swm-1-like [Aphidius gifuensis]